MNWHDIFEYDSGVLRWKISSNRIGKIAGYDKKDGALVGYEGKKYLVRRVIWEMFNGKIPEKHCVINVDRDVLNNKIDNLKTIKKEERNYKRKSSDTIGVHIEGKRYVSRMSVNGKYLRLGSFKTKKEAAVAYDKALIKYNRLEAKSNYPLESYELAQSL